MLNFVYLLLHNCGVLEKLMNAEACGFDPIPTSSHGLNTLGAVSAILGIVIILTLLASAILRVLRGG